MTDEGGRLFCRRHTSQEEMGLASLIKSGKRNSGMVEVNRASRGQSSKVKTRTVCLKSIRNTEDD